MPTTLKDIAEELNISVTAVSRALRNMPDIGVETTKLVHETANRLGYKKNLAASYLKTARSMMFGIVVPDICNPVFSYMYKGIEKRCCETNYTLMLGSSNESAEQEARIIDNMVAHGVDGIFIVPSKESESRYHELKRANIPYIVIQRKNASLPANFIQTNDCEGGCLVADHLYGLGHRRFLLVFANMKISSAEERYQGFTAYLRDRGLGEEAVEILECNSARADGYETVKAWLAKQPDVKRLPISAIFCFSDYIACGVYSALAERGLRVPEDVSVVGYDNNEYSGVINPALTTVDILSYEVGERSVDMMLDLLENDSAPTERNIVIAPKLVIRNSTRKLNN